MTVDCPVCGGEATFLGNESGTGKSWFACRACPLTRQVFSLRLPELLRFGFQGRD
jgi:hypothetical protein